MTTKVTGGMLNDSALTDLGAATLAQGDVLYYNGSNLVNLGAGTSGQFLKTQGAAANPVWADVGGGGKVLQVVEGTVSAATQVGDGTAYYTTSATSSTGSECGTGAITPAATSSKVKIDFSMYWGSSFSNSYKYLFLFKGTTLLKTIAFGYGLARGNESFVFLDSPSTTSSTTYSVRFIQDSTASYTMYANRDENGSGIATLSTGELLLTEIGA